MADNGRRTTGVARECRWVNRAEAFEHFAVHDGPTQSQQHIKPLHWYVTCRLVLEGGFHPDEIKPRPPFIVTGRRGERLIHFDPAAATGGEATVLGGFRRQGRILAVVTSPWSIGKDGIVTHPSPSPGTAVVPPTGMTGDSFRNRACGTASRYEAVALAMIDMREDGIGRLLPDFPPPGSPVRIERFFETLYLRYDERYVYSAPDLKSKTRRIEWSPDSPAFESDVSPTLDYEIRLRATRAALDGRVLCATWLLRRRQWLKQCDWLAGQAGGAGRDGARVVSRRPGGADRGRDAGRGTVRGGRLPRGHTRRLRQRTAHHPETVPGARAPARRASGTGRREARALSGDGRIKAEQRRTGEAAGDH